MSIYMYVGFTTSHTSCCNVDTTVGGLCLPNSQLCPNRREFVFWDAYHTSDAANQIIADRLFAEAGVSQAPPPAPLVGSGPVPSPAAPSLNSEPAPSPSSWSLNPFMDYSVPVPAPAQLLLLLLLLLFDSFVTSLYRLQHEFHFFGVCHGFVYMK